MKHSHLSKQLQVIDALSNGANLTAAAAAAGVHRNTIAYWRRNSPQFQHALARAQGDCAPTFRERAEDLADLAFNALREVVTDPKASPSVRFKTALFIIQTAMPPAPRKAEKPLPCNATPDSDLPAAPKEEKVA
jgi:transposase-like protein